MSLDELEAKQGGEQAWEKSKPGFAEIAEALREIDGPFYLGETGELAIIQVPSTV